jgi:hypothetical protein
MSSIIVNILERFLGDNKRHNEDKGQISFDCPACAADKYLSEGDGKGKLEINYKKGVFKCWVCSIKNNMHGPIEKLIKKYGNQNILRDYLLVKPDTEYTKGITDYVLPNVKLPEEYIPLTNSNTYNPQAYFAKKYLNSRKIDAETIKEYNIGYCPTGTYRNRVIIPSYDKYGDLNYFIARSFNPYVKPKYLMPEIPKEYIIFNENKLNLDSTIYLVEGVFDHIVIPNSIPLLGKYLQPKIKNLLLNDACAEIVILLDDDAEIEAMAIYKELNFGRLKGKIKICTPPYGYDASLIYQKLGKVGIIKLLKNSRIPTIEELI